eukprot:752592-Hanusia_phi.AAC.1
MSCAAFSEPPRLVVVDLHCGCKLAGENKRKRRESFEIACAGLSCGQLHQNLVLSSSLLLLLAPPSPSSLLHADISTMRARASRLPVGGHESFSLLRFLPHLTLAPLTSVSPPFWYHPLPAAEGYMFYE